MLSTAAILCGIFYFSCTSGSWNAGYQVCCLVASSLLVHCILLFQRVSENLTLCAISVFIFLSCGPFTQRCALLRCAADVFQWRRSYAAPRAARRVGKNAACAFTRTAKQRAAYVGTALYCFRKTSDVEKNMFL